MSLPDYDNMLSVKDLGNLLTNLQRSWECSQYHVGFHSGTYAVISLLS